MEIVYEGIKFILDLVNKTQEFKGIDAKFVMNPIRYCRQHEFLSKGYWYCCAMKYITSHNNYPVSTCRIGPDRLNGDVVNSELKVHGIDRLRIADSSVIQYA